MNKLTLQDKLLDKRLAVFFFLNKTSLDCSLPFLQSARPFFPILPKHLCLHCCHKGSRWKCWILWWLLGLHAEWRTGRGGGEGTGVSGSWAVFEKPFSSQSDNFAHFLQLWQTRVVFQLRKIRGYSSISTSGAAFCWFTVYTRAKRLISVTQNQDPQGQNY